MRPNPFKEARRARIVRAVGALVLLVVLFYCVEYCRGRWAWHRCRKELGATGEKLDAAAFVPPPVPDKQNFATTPSLARLFSRGTEYAEQLQKQLSFSDSKQPWPSLGDWALARPLELKEWETYLGTTNVLASLRRLDPVLAEIAEAARRPYARFPLRYDQAYQMQLPHLAALRQLARLYELRGVAALAQGKLDQAMADADTIFCLIGTLHDEPALISQLVRVNMLQGAVQIMWEGMRRHQWSDDHLSQFQNQLRKLDFLADNLQAWRAERAVFFNQTLLAVAADSRLMEELFFSNNPHPNRVRLFTLTYPTGWVYQNMAAGSRSVQERILPIVDLANRRVYPERVAAAAQWRATARTTPYNVFARILLPSQATAARRFAYAQTVVDEAMAACAIERFGYVRNWEIAPSFSRVIPDFLDAVPRDVISGQPLKYQPVGNQYFVLLSVGWNEKDDQAKVALSADKPVTQDLTAGDWVWRSQPAPAAGTGPQDR